MTLLISVANRKFVTLLADRRLTSNGRIVDDHYNKLTVLCCADARVGISFTGLAKTATLDISDWIMSYLQRAEKLDDEFDSIFEGMRTEVEAELKRQWLTKHPLTILVSGFLHRDGKSEPLCLSITNVDANNQVAPAFRNVRTNMVAGKGFAAFAGFDATVPLETKLAINEMADAAIDPRHMVRKVVMTLQRSAKSHKALRTIGEHCNSATILSAPDTTIACTYHCPCGNQLVHGPNAFITNDMWCPGFLIGAEEMLAGPEIAKRDPCWCGSGRRFKDCHMKKFGSVYAKVPGFKEPMTWVIRAELPEARASGKIFCVAGGFE